MAQGEILIIVLVAIVVLVAIGIWLTMRRRNTDRLRDRFGDEYDPTVEDRGGRSAAEADLADREKRVAALDIRPFTPAERDGFTSEWQDVKALFVDSPAESVLHADRMLAKMMQTRGFPMADFDRRYEDLTVDHGDVARHYRDGHSIVESQMEGNATTEDLRQAMKHYELLFDRLVADVDGVSAPASTAHASGAVSSDRSRDDERMDARPEGRVVSTDPALSRD